MKYEIDHSTGCWNFVGSLTKHGYGHVCLKEGTLAHRVSYIRRHGPIPDSLELDHKCRNRRCINPDHLEPVSDAVNVQRGLKAKLTEGQVEEIRRRFIPRRKGDGYGNRSTLRKEFGIGNTQLSRIIRMEQWV